MIHYTLIARLADGLPLSASMVEDEKLNRYIADFQSQAKLLVCRLESSPQSRSTLTAGSFAFHYLLDRGVCYIIITDAQFNRTNAFAFLEAIHEEFFKKFADKIQTASRPYAFIDFDRFIQKTQKIYTDSRSSNIDHLNYTLQDVQRIMIQNIDEVLQRGEALTAIGERASNLSAMSKDYKKDSARLNAQSAWKLYVVFGVVVLIAFTIIYYRYLS